MTDPQAALDKLVAAFRRRRPLRAGSLIVSAFGDMVAPRGGAVLLADLGPLLEIFAINDSQARTALSRLVGDGWLESKRLGRRSLYRLTAQGAHRFAEATRRIYFAAPQDWDGRWTVALLAPLQSSARAPLRRELQWLGFGALSPDTLIHPHPDAQSLASVIADQPQEQRPLLVQGLDLGAPAAPSLIALARQCWALDGLERSYRQFTVAFTPLAQALQSGGRLAPVQAAATRILLIHEYRRILLRDPLLPAVLMDKDWAGGRAYALAREIYRQAVGGGEQWINAHLHDQKGPLPPPGPDFHRRFQ